MRAGNKRKVTNKAKLTEKHRISSKRIIRQTVQVASKQSEYYIKQAYRISSRARGGGARWRRLEALLPERLAVSRARSWRRWWRGSCCPAAGPFRPWDIMVRRRDLRVAAENRHRGVTSSRAFTTRTDGHCWQLAQLRARRERTRGVRKHRPR